MFIFFTAEDAINVLADTVLHIFPLILDFIGLLAQLVLEFHIQIGVEDIPEDLLTLLGICQQQLQEIALGDHGNLGKLLPVKTQNLPDGAVDFLGLRYQMAVGASQGRAGGLLGHGIALVFALGLRFHILRIPGDGIFLSRIAEYKGYFCGGGRIGILRSEHTRFPVAAAGFSEEGKADGIENSGLSRAGVAGDQIQSAGAQSFKVQLHNPGVGAKGGHGQFQRPHFSPSQIDSINSCMKSFWSSVIG